MYVSIVNKTLKRAFISTVLPVRTFEGEDCLTSRSSEGSHNCALDQNLSLWSGQLFLAKFCLEKDHFHKKYKLCIVYISIHSI